MREILNASGLEWRIVEGKKHHRVMIAGRQACVFSKGAKARSNNKDLTRENLNNIRDVKRMIITIKQSQAKEG